MILCIDIGNSNIVFGIWDQDKWVNIWRVQTDPTKTADEYEVIFRSIFSNASIKINTISKTVLSSVVPKLIRPFNEMISRLLNHQPIWLEPSVYEKLPVKTINPDEIGTDLVANATAAFMLYPLPCMVIDFGTALTFTSIARSGQILGVAIAPGINTALRSLTQNTAQLPDVPLKAPPSVLGHNTIHAIQSGLIFGFAGLVDAVVQRTEEELNEELTVVATGGLATVLSGTSKRIRIINQNLTLEGLKYIALTIEQGIS